MKPEFMPRDAAQLLIRHVSGSVTHAEFRILMIIWDHIYGYKEWRDKEYAPIPISRFVNGQGNWACSSTLSERHVFRTLRKLKEQGLISIEGGTTYTHKYSLIPALRMAKAKMSGLTNSLPEEIKPIKKPHGDGYRPKPLVENKLVKTNKKPVRPLTPMAGPLTFEVETTDTGGSPTDTHVRSRVITRAKPGLYNQESKPGNPNVFADAKTKVLSRVDSTKKNTQAIHRQKLDAGKMSALHSHWFEQFRTYFPNAQAVGWTGREFAMLKQLLEDRLAGIDGKRFITFIMSHWVEIQRNKFPNLKAKPDYPELAFVCRFAFQFVDAFNTVEAGETLVAKDRRANTGRTVRQLDAMTAKAASLERQLARERAAKNEVQRDLQRARSDALAAAHPGLTPREILELTLAKKTGKLALEAVTKSDTIKPDLTFEPEEF